MDFTAQGSEAGERIDLVVARRLDVTRSRARAALESGEVTVDGRSVKPSHRLAAGERVEGDVTALPDNLPEAESIPVKIAYEDEHLLVISKPAGLVAHPAGGHPTGTLVNALLALNRPLGQLDPKRPGIVHRLDKDTSGLLLVAKDDATQRRLRDGLKARMIERRYLALVRGTPAAMTGTIEAPIARDPKRRSLMAVAPGGRGAVTHYRVVASRARVALLDVKLETGRTHQIRVHLAHIGHPVLGDRVYGGTSQLSSALGLDRPFLHAWRLTFPTAEGEVEVVDELPEDLTAALERAGIEPLRGPA